MKYEGQDQIPQAHILGVGYVISCTVRVRRSTETALPNVVAWEGLNQLYTDSPFLLAFSGIMNHGTLIQTIAITWS